MTTSRPGEQIKACCAVAYGSNVVALLLGDSYHPGGLTLTRQLTATLDLQPGQRVLDIAAGRGTTALLLAREHRVQVDAVDLSAANIALARGAADAAGLTEQITFTLGDAEQLPYPDATFDAVVCECAWCTFPNKTRAAAEMARVLRPGGRLGITDVTAQSDRLPPELTTLSAWIACVADARPLDEYTRLLTGVGLLVTETQNHDHAMIRMIDQIEARLMLVRLTSPGRAHELGIDFDLDFDLDFDRAGPILAAARQAVAAGSLGYTLITAQKPASNATYPAKRSNRSKHGSRCAANIEQDRPA